MRPSESLLKILWLIVLLFLAAFYLVLVFAAMPYLLFLILCLVVQSIEAFSIHWGVALFFLVVYSLAFLMALTYWLHELEHIYDWVKKHL